MKKMCRILVISCGMFAVFLSKPASSAAPVPAVATSIAKAITKYFGKQGAEEASEYLLKKGGQEVLERVAKNAAEEGGEAVVEQIAKLASKHGPEALAALDNAPSIAPIIGALDELPEAQVKSAIARLAAGSGGRELATAVGRFGVVALRAELKHPGVGLVLVRSLGDEGVDLATRLTSDQAVAVGRHADQISKLPEAQRAGVMSLLRSDTEAMVKFMGRFVAQNPGKSLFTVAATTVILAEPERFLGGDTIVLDADGNPVVVSKPGIVGRSIDAGGAAAAHASENYLRPLYLTAMVFVGAFVAIWMMIKLWHVYRAHSPS